MSKREPIPIAVGLTKDAIDDIMAYLLERDEQRLHRALALLSGSIVVLEEGGNF